MAAVTVAVGILIDDAGRVLVTRRAPDAHQGGLWEFPGGKVEAGETLQEALARELREELGVLVEATEALMVLEHDYGDKQVDWTSALSPAGQVSPEALRVSR